DSTINRGNGAAINTIAKSGAVKIAAAIVRYAAADVAVENREIAQATADQDCCSAIEGIGRSRCNCETAQIQGDAVRADGDGVAQRGREVGRQVIRARFADNKRQ